MSSLSHDEFLELEARYQAGTATSADLEALEPYRAKRAVLVASGFGSRMLPLTINSPKPLIRVKGRRIIETILDALLTIDVTEIYIVVGYLAEEFELLKKDYPSITLIYNEQYSNTNNISSAVCAREHFENAYVFESDLFLKNPAVLNKYSDESFYLGVPVESTPDWCFDTTEDGAKLRDDLPAAFACEENKQRFWDDVPCVVKRENYQVHVRECSFDDIDEIDSLTELQEIDPAYVIK